MIGDNIKKILKEKNIKQESLAKMAEISTVYLSYIINNKRTASVEVLEKIADALDVPVDELFKSGIDKLSDEEVFDEIDRLTDEDRLMFRKYKALSPKDARKILEIIEIFERNNGH